jgi:hypothetical protein
LKRAGRSKQRPDEHQRYHARRISRAPASANTPE